LLAIAAFSLSLLGAFIVRSGVITSVHAFAVDPQRGIVLLTLLLVIIGGSLFLYALRAPVVKGTASYEITSREVFLLINNILLVVSTAAILGGTLAPLIYEAISGEANRVSAGPEYFNIIFLPLMAILSVFLGLSTFSRWKRTSVEYLKQQVSKVVIAAVLLGIALPLVLTLQVDWGVMLALALAFWIVFCIARDLWDKSSNRASRLAALRGLSLGYWGMQLAHFGFAVIICGICLTSHYSVEDDVRMAPGDSVAIGDYEFTFEGVIEQPGPNYDALSATIRVTKGGEDYLTMHPETRDYRAQPGNAQTEADIDVGFFRDIFTALGDDRGDGSWMLRIHYKPFVFWIWFGALLMAAGGVTAVLDRRYRSKRVAADEAVPLTTTNGGGMAANA
jgi:cytochrome c-type biogenesis protein CcmF